VRTLLRFVALVLLASSLSAQEATPLDSVSDEAFRTLADFYGYDALLPLDARVLKREDAPAYTREKVVFTGGRGDRVPAFVMLPKEGKAPHPVVLLIDGWMGGKDRWWEDDTWPRGGLAIKALAAQGFAALVLDAQFHGERAAKLGYLPVEEFVCRECRNLRREMIVESVVDHRRALDYLAGRGDVDMARVGALGHSMGGVMTFALAALDNRLKAGVSCVIPARRGEVWAAPAFSPYTFAPRIRVPMLMLMGRGDPLYHADDARSLFEQVASADKALEFYDADHRLPPEYVPRAVSWLKLRLAER
jgi:dienelactone hydrolase